MTLARLRALRRARRAARLRAACILLRCNRNKNVSASLPDNPERQLFRNAAVKFHPSLKQNFEDQEEPSRNPYPTPTEGGPQGSLGEVRPW